VTWLMLQAVYTACCGQTDEHSHGHRTAWQ